MPSQEDFAKPPGKGHKWRVTWQCEQLVDESSCQLEQRSYFEIPYRDLLWRYHITLCTDSPAQGSCTTASTENLSVRSFARFLQRSSQKELAESNLVSLLPETTLNEHHAFTTRDTLVLLACSHWWFGVLSTFSFRILTTHGLGSLAGFFHFHFHVDFGFHFLALFFSFYVSFGFWFSFFLRLHVHLVSRVHFLVNCLLVLFFSFICSCCQTCSFFIWLLDLCFLFIVLVLRYSILCLFAVCVYNSIQIVSFAKSTASFFQDILDEEQSAHC